MVHLVIQELVPSFCDELAKIAVVTQQPQEGSDNAEHLMGQVAKGVGGAYVASKTPGLIGRQVMKTIPLDTPMTEQRMGEMAKGMGVKTPVHYVKEPRMGANSAHMWWDPKSGMAQMAAKQMGWSPDSMPKAPGHVVAGHPHLNETILAHELGHAKNYEQLGKGWRTGVGLSTGIGRLSNPITSGIAAGQDDPSWKPGLVQAGISAPMLLEEGMASARATRHLMKQHGMGGGLSRGGKMLLPAFSTYAAQAGMPLAITGARKLWRKATGKPSQSTKKQGQ